MAHTNILHVHCSFCASISLLAKPIQALISIGYLMKQTNKYIFQFCETESKANCCRCFFGGKTVLLEAEGRHFPPKNNNSLPSFLYLFFYEFHIGTIKGGQIKESQEPGDRCSRRRTRSKGHRVAEYIERDAGSRRTCNM